MSKPHRSEILTHLGENRDQYFGAAAPPIIRTSTFALPDLDSFRRAFMEEFDAHLYTRGNNPTVEILRKKVAALEGTEEALCFASGSGAVAATVISCVQAGDHVVCVDHPYSWTKTLLEKFLARFGVTYTYVDGRSMADIEAAIQPNTKLLYLESPNTMLFDIQDLTACAKLAKKHGILTAIDNSYASPIYQRPAEFGIDFVIHSATKYLNGHSDAVAGIVCGSREHLKKIFDLEYMCLGGILSPADAHLIIRGLRTLELRLERSSASTLKIATWLEQHPKIERVLYPLLPSFPQYELAKKQMTGAGGLFSCYLKSDNFKHIENFVERLERFLLGVSWGGHESLIVPSVGFYNIPRKADSPVPINFVRFYVGLEDPDWLIEDLEQALEEI